MTRRELELGDRVRLKRGALEGLEGLVGVVAELPLEEGGAYTLELPELEAAAWPGGRAALQRSQIVRVKA